MPSLRLALAHRYKRFRLDYTPRTGMYKGGTFTFQQPTQLPPRM